MLKLCRQQIELVKNGKIGRSDIIKQVIVQAKLQDPTGVAAMNIGVCTLHSRFSLPLKSLTFAELAN